MTNNIETKLTNLSNNQSFNWCDTTHLDSKEKMTTAQVVKTSFTVNIQEYTRPDDRALPTYS